MKVPGVNTRLGRHWLLFIAAAFALGVYHAWFEPGFLIGDDLYRFADSTTRSFFPWRSTWDPTFHFGHTNKLYLAAFPLWSLFGLLTRAGVTFAAGERFVFLR